MRRDPAALGARQHDVLVIGGGIHGAAVAWDAAQRGLSVALVEAADFGSGTSWNSLKTIHGGLRHLQRADLGGAAGVGARALGPAAHRARSSCVRCAFLVPTYGHGLRGREALAARPARDRSAHPRPQRGPARGAPHPALRVLSPAEMLERVPGLEPRGLTGGALWHDAQVASSERLLLGFLHAAAEAGAVLANYAEVTALLSEAGRVAGARVWDPGRRTELEVRARVVVNAAGPALDRVRRWAGIVRPPCRCSGPATSSCAGR